MKKILVIDDSALMRRILCDIINGDERFSVQGQARDGVEGLELVKSNKYDAIVLDINMPNMNGIEFLQELNRLGKHERVIILSTDAADGADVTIKALELGALDFIQKPKNTLDSRGVDFRQHFLSMLHAASEVHDTKATGNHVAVHKPKDIANKVVSSPVKTGKRKIVALCSSTGGPKALQQVIPYLPKNMDAPLILVQHMPAGFTKSLADRLDSMSQVKVTEAVEGDVLEKGHVYISKGGMHLNYKDTPKGGQLYYSDEPAREGVKPCANYMYESLLNSDYYDEVVCVVLTGMGADGTAGIKNLKQGKEIYVISQNEETCTVYGMPKAIYSSGLVNKVVSLDKVAQEIITNVGVR